jgi:hypothetical protein
VNQITAPPRARSLFDEWTLARPYLLPAIERLHGVSENDILAGLLAGHYVLRLAKNSALLLQTEFFGTTRALNFFAAGGDKDELLVLESTLCEAAPSQGYTLATARGRKGWEKDAEKRGWKFDYIAMYKELV